MLDHYQAVVKTFCARLARVGERPLLSDQTGGSTYTMLVWPGHPLQDEVIGTLARVRQKVAALRGQVAAYNAEHDLPPRHQSVVFYAGQCTTEETPATEEEDEQDESLS